MPKKSLVDRLLYFGDVENIKNHPVPKFSLVKTQDGDVAEFGCMSLEQFSVAYGADSPPGWVSAPNDTRYLVGVVYKNESEFFISETLGKTRLRHIAKTFKHKYRNTYYWMEYDGEPKNYYPAMITQRMLWAYPWWVLLFIRFYKFGIPWERALLLAQQYGDDEWYAHGTDGGYFPFRFWFSHTSQSVHSPKDLSQCIKEMYDVALDSYTYYMEDTAREFAQKITLPPWDEHILKQMYYNDWQGAYRGVKINAETISEDFVMKFYEYLFESY